MLSETSGTHTLNTPHYMIPHSATCPSKVDMHSTNRSHMTLIRLWNQPIVSSSGYPPHTKQCVVWHTSQIQAQHHILNHACVACSWTLRCGGRGCGAVHPIAPQSRTAAAGWNSWNRLSSVTRWRASCGRTKPAYSSGKRSLSYKSVSYWL